MGQLSKRPELLILADVLAPNWDPTNTVGYDLSVTDRSKDAYLPHGTGQDSVGEAYPSLVTTFSNETVPGESGYSYLTNNGPGQDKDGSVVATLRAQGGDGTEYTGDSATYSAVGADDVLYQFEQEIERACRDNNDAPNTELYNVAAYPAGAVTDDRDEAPPVRIRSVTIVYDYLVD